jgi:hypothetical protein
VTITVVQAPAPVQNASLTTATVTLANPTTQNNTLVVCVTTNGTTSNPQISSVTIGGLNDNWQAAVTPNQVTTFGGGIWYDPGCAGGQTSIVVTCTGGAGTTPEIYVSAFEVAGLLVFDQGASQVNAVSGTTWSSGTTAAVVRPAEIFFACATATSAVPTVTGAGTWTTQSTAAGSFDQISGYQITASAGTATFSGTIPSGTYLAAVATFFPGGPTIPAATPGRTWLRRFHHRQALLPFPTTVVVGQTGPPVYPWPGPVRARVLPLTRGRNACVRGVFDGTGPAFPAPQGPVRTRVVLPPRGRVQRNAGVFDGTGPPFPAPHNPVRAQPGAYRKGRAAAVAGTFGGTGPPFPAPHGPVRARVPAPIRGGRTSWRSGVFDGTGPPFPAAPGPVRTRVPMLARGRTSGQGGPFDGSGPAFPAPHGPARSRVLPLPRGRTQWRAGTFTAFAGTPGPPVYPLQGPVRSRVLPLRRGWSRGTAGTFTAPPQTGPPVYPWHGPVRARIASPVRGGQIQLRRGLVQGTGPAPNVWHKPVSAVRLPPWSKGTIRALKGSYGGTGPAAVRLTGPVARRLPPLTLPGRRWFTPPYLAPVPPAAIVPAAGPVTVTDPRDGTHTVTDPSTGLRTITDPRDGSHVVAALTGTTGFIQDEAGATVLDEGSVAVMAEAVTASTGTPAKATVSDPREGPHTVT